MAQHACGRNVSAPCCQIVVWSRALIRLQLKSTVRRQTACQPCSRLLAAIQVQLHAAASFCDDKASRLRLPDSLQERPVSLDAAPHPSANIWWPASTMRPLRVAVPGQYQRRPAAPANLGRRVGKFLCGVLNQRGHEVDVVDPVDEACRS